MIKALLFDMDGLIFDTEWIYKESWQYATHLQGFELSDELYYAFIGVQDKDCERLLTLHVSDKIDLDMHRNTRNAYFNSMRDSGGIKYKLRVPCPIFHIKKQKSEMRLSHVITPF